MKKILLSVLAFCIAFVACDEGLDVNLNAPYSAEVTLEAALVTDTGEPISIETDAINTAEALEDYSDKMDKLESAKLKSVTVTILSPATQTFSFVNGFEIFITGQGMDEQKVAEKTEIDQTATSFDLDIEDVELVEVIQSGEFSGRAVVVTDELIQEDVQLKIDYQFNVKAAVID